MQTIKLFIIIFGTLLLVNCSTPTKNELMTTDNKNPKDTCCSNDTTKVGGQIVMQSEITCPKCGHKKMETMPTDVCVIKYNCEKCNTEMLPKDGDCCVFCTYGTHKCPSMQ
ncbi:MAG: hypothetical protein C0448_07820 [Sphingobacteriaceae bacterium]|nr:hypothetical protein [Sphingobacteriaceae bacterium]